MPRNKQKIGIVRQPAQAFKGACSLDVREGKWGRREKGWKEKRLHHPGAGLAWWFLQRESMEVLA